jgi:hypothetical protein
MNKNDKRSIFKLIFGSGKPKKAANDARFNGGGDYTPPNRPILGRGAIIWT